MVPINHHHDPLPPTLPPPPRQMGGGKQSFAPATIGLHRTGGGRTPSSTFGAVIYTHGRHPLTTPPPQHSIAPRPPFGGESVGGGEVTCRALGSSRVPCRGGGVALIPNSPGRPSALRCPPPLICGAAAEGALILLLRTMPNSATAAPGTDVTPRAAAPSLCPRFVPPVFPPLLGGRRGSEAAALRRAAGRGRCRTANGARRAHSDEGRG